MGRHVSTEPGVRSGWHHHGETDTYFYVLRGSIELEFGPGGHERRQQLAGSLLETLTSREMEVLSEMAQGKSNAAISVSLFISPSAVEKHINSIFGKLTLSAEDGAQHRRVAAVLAFLRNQDLRRSSETPPS